MKLRALLAPAGRRIRIGIRSDWRFPRPQEGWT